MLITKLTNNVSALSKCDYKIRRMSLDLDRKKNIYPRNKIEATPLLTSCAGKLLRTSNAVLCWLSCYALVIKTTAHTTTIRLLTFVQFSK